ncbi:MAG: serine/threonine protein kinase, partial [Candidatus Korarchaeum sp.]
EYVSGVRMADSIDDSNMLAFGIASCRLHSSNIAHNDLTPYNALVVESGGICLLDFGLAEYTHDVESYAVDLYVLKRSLKSIKEDWEPLWVSFLRGYSTCGMAERVIRRLEQVEARGRYK